MPIKDWTPEYRAHVERRADQATALVCIGGALMICYGWPVVGMAIVLVATGALYQRIRTLT